MSSEDCDWFQPPDLPLLNNVNVALKLVFEHLKKKELKECRLVCKTWNVLTIPYTRKAFRITIYGNNSRDELHKIEKFVEDFRSNELGIPFGRFKLGSFCTTDGVGQEFLKLCGDTITDIEFSEEIYMVDDVAELLKSTPKLKIFQTPGSLQSRSRNVVKLFPDGLENSKSKLTSLKELIVPRDFVLPKEKNKCCPTFLEEIITGAQNISCLDLPRSCLFRGLEVMNLIEKLGRESFIQELRMSVGVSGENDYDGYCADPLLRLTLKPNGLRLKRLLYIFDYRDKYNLVLQLISSSRDSLESLHLNLRGTPCPNFTEFSKMSRLTTMSLSWLPENSKFRCVNLIEIFPVLHELKLCELLGLPKDEFFPDSAPCPNMNALELQLMNGMTINGFNQMLNVFPKLTKLEIIIRLDGAEILRQIWSQMTQLESLIIRGEIQTVDSLDSLLTGIPTHALQKIIDVVANLNGMKTEIYGNVRRDRILNLRNQYSTLPSIGNLTNLRSLSMELSGEDDFYSPSEGQFITDLSGYFGLYSMQRLKHLSVQKCELKKTCCELLRKDMGLETWNFKTLEYEDIIPSMENVN